MGALELVLCRVPLNPKPIPFQFRVKIGTHVESLKCVSCLGAWRYSPTSSVVLKDLEKCRLHIS